jgi:hypothetical protein
MFPGYRRTPASHEGSIHNIIMHERCNMEKLYGDGHIEGIPGISAGGFTGKTGQKRPDPLPSLHGLQKKSPERGVRHLPDHFLQAVIECRQEGPVAGRMGDGC